MKFFPNARVLKLHAARSHGDPSGEVQPLDAEEAQFLVLGHCVVT